MQKQPPGLPLYTPYSYPGVDPGIAVGAQLYEAEGLGATLRPPVGVERSPGGDPEAP